MSIVVALNAEQQAICERVRAFAQECIAPIAAERDRIVDPTEAFPVDIWHEGARRGLRTLSSAAIRGGLGMDVLTHCAAVEELCAADAGLGVVFSQNWKLQQLLEHTPYLRDEILPKFLADPDYHLCLAMTEPAAGSDNVLPYGGVDGGARTSAVRGPDGGWILNGTKDFITNAGIAKGAFVVCRTDATQPIATGATVFFVESDTPGFRFGTLNDKLGWRLKPNGELIFEDVGVADAARVTDVGGAMTWLGAVGAMSAATVAAYGIGTARRALELTRDRLQTRIQGGRPIGEHQAVQLRFSDMWADIELARTITWRAAWSAQYAADHDAKLGPLAQLYSAEMVVRVCYLAMQLWGGLGFMRGAIEKLMRDALANYHTDGLNDLNRIRLARALLGTGEPGYLI